MTITELGEKLGRFNKGSFATIDENDVPDIRGWELQFIENGRPYFTTSSQKKVYRQLQNKPVAAFFCMANGLSVRICGRIAFLTDEKEIQAIYDHMDPGVQKLYPTIHDNGFLVGYFESGAIEYAEGKGAFETLRF